MAAHHDLDKLAAAMNDLDSRLHRLNVALIKNEDEIAILVVLQDTLEQNIVELKRQHVIAMASEYKKAKEDLQRTLIRLQFLRMDRATYEKAFNGHAKMHEYLQKQFDETMERITNNVIQVDFGRKDG